MAYQLNLNWPEFLEKYWQKQPVVLKNAFPNFVDPITPDELAGLAMEPEVLLFDEPTSALDPELVGEVLRIITAYPKGYLRIIGIFCSLQVIFLCLPYCSLCWSGGSGVLAEFQSMVVSGSFGCWPDMAQDISIRSDLWHCYWRSCSLYGRWADFLYRQRAKTRLF